MREAIDLTKVAQTFPGFPSPFIARDNIIETFEASFASGIEVIVLEAPDGSGKTMTAAQFAARHPDRSLSLFVRSESRWGYDPEFVRLDLCQQLAAALGRSPLGESEALGEPGMRQLLFSFRTRAKRDKYYFVIDGLHEVPPSDHHTVSQIWEMFPIGFPNCHFLVTDDGQLQKRLTLPTNKKIVMLPTFILEESLRYLGSLPGLEKQTAEELHRTCKGIPGRLASVRRLLGSGVTPGSIIEEVIQQLPDLFDLEWRWVDAEDEVCLKLLAHIAHDSRRQTVPELASITGLDQETVENKLKPLPFIVIPPNSSHVTFVSEAFRKHAVARLSRLRSEVEEAIINEMLKNPDSERTRELLPGYLYKVGKFDHLLNFLTPEYLDLMLQSSQSIAPVKQKVELGVQASVQLHRDSDLIRFSIHGSALMQLDSADAWKSEIEARIALDDFQTAIALAQSAPLKEDRLHLLAVVAKGRRKRGMTPEPELVDNIRLLYDQIDTSRLGRRAYEIASDLVYTDHDLAMRLIEGARETDPEEVDLEIATLALNSRKLASIEEGDAAEKIRSRIRSPQLRQFSQEMMLMVQDYTAREILAEVKKLGDASRKLFYLRRWTLKNRRNQETPKVIEEALGIAIAATEYTPNARDMRELASPLPFVVDRASAERIIRMFDAQKGSIEHYGPSIDYVRLQLLIARCEYGYDLEKSRARFEDAYLYILDISDLSVRAECLARLLSALVRTDESRRPESVAELHIQVERELKSAVAELLDATALHDEVFEGIIRALSVGCLDLAVEIAQSLNTEPRRDAGLLEAIGGAAGSEKRVRLDQLHPLITSIIDPETRSQAILSVLQSVASRGGFDEATAAELLPYLQLIENMDDVKDKIQAYSTLYQILAGVESMRFGTVRGHIAEKFKDCLRAVDEGWEKVQLAFEIVSALAPHSVSEASGFLKIAEEAKKEILLQTRDIASAYIGTVLLAIAAYSGLLPRRLATDEDTRKLSELIEQIPSEGQRAWVWAELALRAHAKDEAALCKDVVATRIRPLLQSLAEMNLQHSREIVVLVAPALYCANPINARRDFDELPLHLRDYAILRTCLFMMRRHTLHEPYEHSLGQGYDLSYDQILVLVSHF